MNNEELMHYVIIILLLYLIYLNVGIHIGNMIVKEHLSPATITQLNANKLDNFSRPLYQ